MSKELETEIFFISDVDYNGLAIFQSSFWINDDVALLYSQRSKAEKRFTTTLQSRSAQVYSYNVASPVSTIYLRNLTIITMEQKTIDVVIIRSQQRLDNNVHILRHRMLLLMWASGHQCRFTLRALNIGGKSD